MDIKLGIGPLHRQMGNLLSKMDAATCTKFDIDKAELATEIDDYNFLGWVLGAKTAYQSYSKSWTDFADHLVQDVDTNILAILPTLPTLPAVPAVPFVGIRDRFEKFCKKIANHKNCTQAILVNLGVASDPATSKPSIVKPVAKVKLEAGHPLISYKKGDYTGVRIYKDFGDGNGFIKFDKSNLSKFKDDSPLPPADTAVIWRYRLIFLQGNTEVGELSDVIEITVAGI